VWHAMGPAGPAERRGCLPRFPRPPATVNSRAGYRGAVDRSLRISACRALCSWHASGEPLDGEPLFACAGCGSEWVASEPWTPVDHTGTVPAQVAAARLARGRG
jgi:hypothetical protein